MGMGIGQFLGGIGEVLGRVATYIPGQVERWKDERENLVKEQNVILYGDCNEKTSKRMDTIKQRIAYLDRRLRDKAKD